jgi:NAD(P)H-hydrate epimerase
MKTERVGPSILKTSFPKKDPHSHKGQYGRLLVIGGSFIMTGAPVLVGTAAMRSGADLVYFIGPERAMNVAANSSPNFITYPLEGDFLEERDLENVFDFAQKMRVTSLAIGPGLGREERTLKTIAEIIGGFDAPMVIDADALHALSGYGRIKHILKGKDVVLTPHADEFHEMTGEKPSKSVDERIDLVRDAAERMGATVLLKGKVDVISDGERVATNSTGNQFMSKGGTGDVLTGVCASLLSRKINKVNCFTAACAAAYINGKAGDVSAKKLGLGLTATDVLDAIPDVIGRR